MPVNDETATCHLETATRLSKIWTTTCSGGSHTSVVCMDSKQSEKSTSFHPQDSESRGIRSEDAASHPDVFGVFWHANLTSHMYVHRDPKVHFDDLWPSAAQLSELLDCLCGDERQQLISTYTKLSLRCGPVKMLQALFSRELIDLNHTFDDGKSLLHVACLASNVKAVAFLISRGASLKITDKAGLTADQLCFCSNARKELPSRYQTSLRMHKKQVASLEEKQKVFELVMDAECFEDIQFLLHTLDFDINAESDSNGDLLLHRAVRQGMSHLALVMNLVLVHRADVQATDSKGMTPLCIAAQSGYGIVAEVLMCVLGADPNARNSLSHWTPLHFAAKENNVSVVEYLVRRGADVNMEDKFGCRADDIVRTKKVGSWECKDVIENLRTQRCQQLISLAKEGNLNPHLIRPTDMCTVDSTGLTLLMVAAQANRCDNLMVLLHKEKCPIDAQDMKFGQTALSLAAMFGKADAVQTLLRYGAHPGIRDINGMLPLHHACRKCHVLCAQMIVNDPKGLTGLLTAMKYTDNSEIHTMIEEAVHRRQMRVAIPTLFECAMNGDADRLYTILEEGDDVNPLTSSGDWPLYMAVGNRYIDVMQLLHSNGGDIWSQHQTTGSTVLHLACSRGLYDIVSYLLRVSKTNGSSSSPSHTNGGDSPANRKLDINVINHRGQTALQVAAAKGFSRIVNLLLSHGATSALLDSQGQLYKCNEFEGVQFLIEHHQRSRTEQIMSYIKTTSKLHRLFKVWQAKFDHNLRNRNGDTPLMVASLYGKIEALTFLLRSAIQSMEEEQGTGMLMQRHNESFVDSGAFDEESNPVSQSAGNISLQTVEESCTEQDVSMTDISDQEIGSRRAMQNPCSKCASKLKGFSSSVSLPSRHRFVKRTLMKRRSYDPVSTDDSTDDIYSDSCKVPSSQPAVLNSKRAFYSANDLNTFPSVRDLSDKDAFASSHGLAEASLSRSRLHVFQGTCLNHLCAVNIRDGCTAMHRAVQCIHQQRGLASLLLLMEKDSSVINLQNFHGLTPLHLAARLEKKKIIKTLMSLPCVNSNLRSKDGKLPEDMTRSKRIARIIRDARKNQEQRSPSSMNGTKLPSPPESNVGGTSIDFDKLEKRFEQLMKSSDL